MKSSTTDTDDNGDKDDDNAGHDDFTFALHHFVSHGSLGMLPGWFSLVSVPWSSTVAVMTFHWPYRSTRAVFHLPEALH